jgi:uncharacterized membrane protein YfcA
MLIALSLLVTGIFVGVMNSVAGGGTLLIFPVLMALGAPALVANATSYVAVLPGRLSAIVGYWPFLKKLPKLYILLLIPALLGAVAGGYLLNNTSSKVFDSIVPLLLVLALILFAIQPWFKRHILYHIDKRHKKNNISIILIAISLFLISMYGGYFGAGLGFALLALLGFNEKYKMHYLNGIKNVIGALTSIVVICMLFQSDVIHWEYGAYLAIGNIIGGYYGAKFSLSVPSHNIRWLVLAVGTVTAGYLLFSHV